MKTISTLFPTLCMAALLAVTACKNDDTADPAVPDTSNHFEYDFNGERILLGQGDLDYWLSTTTPGDTLIEHVYSTKFEAVPSFQFFLSHLPLCTTADPTGAALLNQKLPFNSPLSDSARMSIPAILTASQFDPATGATIWFGISEHADTTQQYIKITKLTRSAPANGMCHVLVEGEMEALMVRNNGEVRPLTNGRFRVNLSAL